MSTAGLTSPFRAATPRSRRVRRRHLAWLALLAALSLVASACNGDDPAEEAEPAEPDDAAAEEEPAEDDAPDDDAPEDDGEEPVEVQQVDFRLNWVIAGNHAPFFLAQERGYWEECGLDVNIAAGSGSGDTAQVVGTGAQEFGLTDAASIIPGRAEGLPVQSLGVLYQDNPSSIVARADSGIEDLPDVEGKQFGAVPGGSPYLLLQWIWEENDIDVDSIDEFSVPAPGIAQLQAGQVDFITFFASEVVNIDPNPEENLTVLPFSDYGLDAYGLAIASSDDYTEDNPDQVQCFLDGVRQGLDGAQEDPDAALDALYAASAEAAEAPEVQEQMLEAIWPLVGDEPLAQDEDKWDTTQQILHEAGITDQTLDPSEFFTDEF